MNIQQILPLSRSPQGEDTQYQTNYRKCGLLALPCELTLKIFFWLPTISDALSLAATCTHLRRVLQDRRNRIAVLRTISHVPKERNYQLEKHFSALVREPPSKWRIDGGDDDCSYMMTVDFSSFSKDQISNRALRDLLSIFNSAADTKGSEERFHEALLDFTFQFYSLEHRLGSTFDPLTYAIISDAAELQEHILRSGTKSNKLKDLSTEATIIALTLHCFAIVMDLSVADACQDIYGEEDNIHWEPNDDQTENPLFPALTVEWKEERLELPSHPTKKSGWELDAPIGTMFEYIGHVTRQLLDRLDPKDWPTILYVICILKVIDNPLLQAPNWMKSLENSFASLQVLVSDLCRLYFISTDGGHPFTLDSVPPLDVKQYKVLARGDEFATEHFSALRELWVDGAHGLPSDERLECSPEMYRGLDNFVKKVDMFVFAFE